MDKHTKEPWEIGEQPYMIFANHELAAECYSMESFNGARDANARRIVACVNACKGIDTKFLEEALLAGEEPALYVHTLMQQRDELLAALKRIQRRSYSEEPCEELEDVQRDLRRIHEIARMSIAVAEAGK